MDINLQTIITHSPSSCTEGIPNSLGICPGDAIFPGDAKFPVTPVRITKFAEECPSISVELYVT